MKTSEFDYYLPPELIAQEPLAERSSSRMLVLHRDSGTIEHRHVSDLPRFLNKGDIIVLNDTKVFPARLFGCRLGTGGNVEMLLIEELGSGVWDCMMKAGFKLKPGIELELAKGRLHARIEEDKGEGRAIVSFSDDDPMDVIETEGFMPVPPYIKRDHEDLASVSADRDRYQTVYAKSRGAVAAPTAGLHLTKELLVEISDKGVQRADITLHVGPGTFKPVKVEDVEDHDMEAERYIVTEESARRIHSAHQAGGRVVAVGSTSVRTLETVSDDEGDLVPGEGRSSLFIVPPYEFKVVDVMLTNFHLPKSTLMMMISAFAGREHVLKAYEEAVADKYRFYSYGDCMLIL
jgi:S-adenosylmethionine:tRNA ribosyltransferase-isomerase